MCLQEISFYDLNASVASVLVYSCVVWGFVEKLLVKEDPGMYAFINQGCLGVDGMDDKEEMRLTDVCIHGNLCYHGNQCYHGVLG